MWLDDIFWQNSGFVPSKQWIDNFEYFFLIIIAVTYFLLRYFRFTFNDSLFHSFALYYSYCIKHAKYFKGVNSLDRTIIFSDYNSYLININYIDCACNYKCSLTKIIPYCIPMDPPIIDLQLVLMETDHI